MSDFENVCDAVLKGAFYFCLGFLIVIPCLVLLVLPIIVLASEGFWALIALEMLARGLTDAGDSWHELIGWALRVPGVAIAPLTVVVPWLAVWVLQNGHHRSREQQMRPPTDLPAAAVSLLKEHEVKGQRCWRQFWRCARGGRLRSPGSGRSPASMALMN